jgi:holo-[acyl-carrier protein] synthase
VSAESVSDSISTHGSHYLDRVYSEREIADCQRADAVDPERLAARFAAKEATMKVLRVGTEAVAWRDIEVRRQESGWVEVLLTGRAATLASDAGITELAVSLTHEHGFCCAVVIAEISTAADN